jgi:hypothetical protein
MEQHSAETGWFHLTHDKCTTKYSGVFCFAEVTG